jgi:hypothetical protein
MKLLCITRASPIFVYADSEWVCSSIVYGFYWGSKLLCVVQEWTVLSKPCDLHGEAQSIFGQSSFAPRWRSLLNRLQQTIDLWMNVSSTGNNANGFANVMSPGEKMHNNSFQYNLFIIMMVMRCIAFRSTRRTLKPLASLIVRHQ